MKYFTLLLLVCSFSYASKNLKGESFERNKLSNKRLMELVKPKANQGNPASQYQLAKMHYRGQGTNVNYIKAFYWFEKASKKGHMESQKELAKMYFEGRGGIKDYKKSLYWYQKASANSSKNDQFKIAKIHYEYFKNNEKAKPYPDARISKKYK